MTVIEQATTARERLALLATLFCYPDASYGRRVPEGLFSSAADDHVQAFAAEIAGMSVADIQSLYTSTFDLAPVCSPYLGIHLFGDEGRERARLMVGLRLDYKRMGDERYGELPDHIAEVLRFAPMFSDEEWADLESLILVPALTKMQELLKEPPNPYRHLVGAALALTGSNGGQS